MTRLVNEPASSDLATLIAMADSDEVVGLRLLRAIRDLGLLNDSPQIRPSDTTCPHPVARLRRYDLH